MRYVVRKPDGRYVRMLLIPGCSPPTTYTMSTPDPKDAHDFKSRGAAEKFIREEGSGEVKELTDEGYWPMDE